MLVKITLEHSFGRYSATARDGDGIELATARRASLKEVKAMILGRVTEEVGPDYEYEWLDLTEGSDDV